MASEAESKDENLGEDIKPNSCIRFSKRDNTIKFSAPISLEIGSSTKMQMRIISVSRQRIEGEPHTVDGFQLKTLDHAFYFTRFDYREADKLHHQLLFEGVGVTIDASEDDFEEFYEKLTQIFDNFAIEGNIVKCPNCGTDINPPTTSNPKWLWCPACQEQVHIFEG